MGKRVMVVDDSRMVEIQMKKLLENTQYEVVSFCRKGEDAVARYADIQPDLVTMDILMPGMDGLEASRILLEAHPDAKIVMMSHLAYDETIDEAMSIGARGFIAKPLDRERVLSALDKAGA